MASVQGSDDFCHLDDDVDSVQVPVESFNQKIQKIYKEAGLVLFYGDYGQIALDMQKCETFELATQSINGTWNSVMPYWKREFAIGPTPIPPDAWDTHVVPGAQVRVVLKRGPILPPPLPLKTPEAPPTLEKEYPSLESVSDVLKVTKGGRYRLAFCNNVVYTIIICSTDIDARRIFEKYKWLPGTVRSGTWVGTGGAALTRGRPTGTREPYICLAPALKEGNFGGSVTVIVEGENGIDSCDGFRGNSINKHIGCPTQPLLELEICKAIAQGLSIITPQEFENTSEELRIKTYTGEPLPVPPPPPLPVPPPSLPGGLVAPTVQSPPVPVPSTDPSTYTYTEALVTSSAINSYKKNKEIAFSVAMKSLFTALLGIGVTPYVDPYQVYYEKLCCEPSLKNFDITGVELHNVSLFGFAKENGELTTIYTMPLTRCVPGHAGEEPKLDYSDASGCYNYKWDSSEFILFKFSFGHFNFARTFCFIAYPKEQSESTNRLILAVSAWQNPKCNFYTFNQGCLKADPEAWRGIEGSTWDEVFLDESRKKILKDSVEFFSESTKERYRCLRVKHQRGLILHGPPGNGKTTAIKAIVADAVKGHNVTVINVKNIVSKRSGDEWALDTLFREVRDHPRCILILEDIDCLVGEHILSEFLNTLDGLGTNSGLLTIATTNNLGKLHNGLSQRPSRFDRRIFFDNPNYELRVSYFSDWQIKLSDEDAQEMANLTDGFTFAQIKEALMDSSKLVLTSGKGDFSTILKSQIELLKSEWKAAERKEQIESQAEL